MWAVTRFAIIVPALLVLAGCADDPADREPDAAVYLTEFVVSVNKPLRAGENALLVSNRGFAHHNLTICPGDDSGCAGDPKMLNVLRKPDGARDPSLIPEQTRGLTLGDSWEALISVQLDPGSYRLFCAVINHAEKGMATTIDVAESA